MQNFVQTDTKSNSADSHVHVAVDEHLTDDAAKFHWKFRGMAGEEFNTVVSKTHGLSSPLRRMKYCYCRTIESFSTLTWYETRGHSQSKLCDTANNPLGIIGPLFGGVHFYGDSGYEIRRLFGITEERVNPVRQGGHVTKVHLQSIKELWKPWRRDRAVFTSESQLLNLGSEAFPKQPCPGCSQCCCTCSQSRIKFKHHSSAPHLGRASSCSKYLPC
jgi:hypothetical protein